MAATTLKERVQDSTVHAPERTAEPTQDYSSIPLDKTYLTPRPVAGGQLIRTDFVIGQNGSAVPGRIFVKLVDGQLAVDVEVGGREAVRAISGKGNEWSLKGDNCEVNFNSPHQHVLANIRFNGAEMQVNMDGTVLHNGMRFLKCNGMGRRLTDNDY